MSIRNSQDCQGHSSPLIGMAAIKLAAQKKTLVCDSNEGTRPCGNREEGNGETELS